MMDFSAYRDEFPITEDKTFLNHAAISPTPKRVVAALENLFHEFSHEGSVCYPRWMERVEEVRRLFASLIGASSKEVAFVGNTSEGLSLVASGLFQYPGRLLNRLKMGPPMVTLIYRKDIKNGRGFSRGLSIRFH